MTTGLTDQSSRPLSAGVPLFTVMRAASRGRSRHRPGAITAFLLTRRADPQQSSPPAARFGTRPQRQSVRRGRANSTGLRGFCDIDGRTDPDGRAIGCIGGKLEKRPWIFSEPCHVPWSGDGPPFHLGWEAVVMTDFIIWATCILSVSRRRFQPF